MLFRIRLYNILPYLLFATVYAFAYLPYFIYAPLPEFAQDAYCYFWYASLIKNGNVPFPIAPVDVPVGYPLFVWALKKLLVDTGSVIVVQNIIFVLSGFYLIACLRKLNNAFGWTGAMTLAIFCMDDAIMRYNTSLYTESLYMSSLFLVVARMAVFVSQRTGLNILLLLSAIFIACLIRSNGVYLFFLFPFVLLFVLQNKLGAKQISSMFGGLVAVLVAWSFINYYFKNIFAPGDPRRLQHVIARAAGEINDLVYAPTPKPALFYSYLTSYGSGKPSFYFNVLPSRFEKFYTKDKYNDPNQLLFRPFKVDSAAPELKDYLMQEYIGASSKYAIIAEHCNIGNPKRNKWMYGVHLISRAKDWVFFNVVWIGLFFIAGVFWLVKTGVSRFRHSLSFFFSMLFLIHFLSMVVVTLAHPRFQMRYLHVSAFLVLLVVISSAWLAYSKFVKQNYAQQ